MALATSSVELDQYMLENGQTWYDLYTWLLPVVEIWVRDAGVISWSGQQREVAEDVALEAVMRTFRYSQRSRDGEMPPIGSLKALCRVIARNYFRDWRKKDWCLVRPDAVSNGSSLGNEIVDPSQLALDHLLMDALIVSIARALAKFPQGQKAALLTDLANLSDLSEGDGPSSRLEQALAAVGLRLSDYDPHERGRYAALRSIAYKRLKSAVQT
jgi:DNA-directed RNA polymerase specialized sigma24 family protein